jgi:uncharacterized protein
MFILIFIFTMALSLFAVARVKRTYAKYSKFPASSGISGAEAAYRILEAAGIHDVEISEHQTMLGDHYDPLHKRLVLSSGNYHGRSLAALGVAAHECGHAIQHQMAYAPLHWRMAAIGVTNFANQIVTFLPIFGIMTNIIQPYTGFMIMAIAWGVIMGFNLITLPVEFDASRRAKAVLTRMGFTRSHEEDLGVKKVLDAAAWTYVAAFITSLLYFLFYLLPLLAGGRRDD